MRYYALESGISPDLADLEAPDLECAYPWPRLPDEVLGESSYPTAVDLADRTVVLPVHQHVGPAEIEGVRARLR